MEADSVILSILLCIIYVAPIVAYVVAFIRPKALPWFGNFMLTALPIALIIWIIASCWVGIHYSGLPSLNIFLNLLCVAAVVLGIVYMKRNKRLGFYAIIMSVLLHVGSSFLTKFDSESVITVIVIDAILLVLFVLTVFLKNKDGIRLINLLSPYSEPALTTTILRVYNIVAVVVFIFIMFLFPTWRSARDRVSYFHTYYNTYEYYDNDGKWYDTQRNWVFSPSVDGQRLVSPGYYYVHSRYKKTEKPIDEGYEGYEEYEGNSTAVVNESRQHDHSNHDDRKPESQKTDIIKTIVKDEECPSCHGSKVCNMCGGQGFIWMELWNRYIPCTVCTNGKCLTCNGEGIIHRTYVQTPEGQLIDLNTYYYDLGRDVQPSHRSSHQPTHIDLPVSSEHPCYDCGALKGLCPQCAGRGWKRVETSYGYEEIDCTYCNGTGHCPTCHGTGKVYY